MFLLSSQLNDIYLEMTEDGNYANISIDKRVQRITFNDDMDAKYGFIRYKGSAEKVGWLINMQPVSDCIHL